MFMMRCVECSSFLCASLDDHENVGHFTIDCVLTDWYFTFMR